MTKFAKHIALLMIGLFTITGAMPAWARGGGGCFLPETPILRGDGTAMPISRIRMGDPVMAFQADASMVTARVNQVFTQQESEYFVVTTDQAVLNVTATHPFCIGAGTFKELRLLKAGDTILAFDGQGLTQQRIISIEHRPLPITVYNLQADKPHTFFAAGIAVHNKGGCFPSGTFVKTPAGDRAIETLAPGDTVLARRASGVWAPTVIKTVFATRSPLRLIQTDLGTIRTTPDHPLAVADGVFTLARHVPEGGHVLMAQNGLVKSAEVLGNDDLKQKVTVFNLTVDSPHTFIADGFVVHNKGGGCFLADTPILRADGSAISISRLKPNDRVLAFREDASVVTASVSRITTRPVDEYYVIHTDRTILQVTAEHPFYVDIGTFKTVESLKIGDRVLAFDGSGLSEQFISNIEWIHENVTVYNLETDEPHTFFAAGVAVHNKGGGGGHGSYHGGSSGSSGGDPMAGLIVMGVFVFIVIVSIVNSKRQKQDENLDFCYSSGEISKKSDKTRKLLNYLARQDALFKPEFLEETTKTVFLKLQECWQERNYDPMQPLMMPDLYNQHLQQIRGMIRNHEINRMEDIRIDHIDLVNLRYTHKDYQREFTALITATIKDYYVDDRTDKFLRGDDSAAQFQEFWTFQLQNGKWILREIEQTRESDALKDENFVEAFTDVQLEQVYGEAVEKTGPAGPWLEKAAAAKAVKIERMLNFLYETDKLWNRQQMLERARQVFTDVYMAREAGQLTDALAAQLFPAVAQKLKEEISANKANGRVVEYRNFCVRKVELLLVRNFSDNSKDEYFTRISAHAQTVINQKGQLLSQDEDVSPFEEYWTVGRLDNQWKLKDILPSASGKSVLQAENLDEESSPDQVQWYYTKKRTV